MTSLLLGLALATPAPTDEVPPSVEHAVWLSPRSTRRPPPRGVPWHPYTVAGAPLDTSAFYATVGREDEQTRHQRRQRNRWLACAGAIGLSAVGGALTSAYVLPELTDNGGVAAAGLAGGLWVAVHLPAFAVVPLMWTNSRRGRHPALSHDEAEAQAWVDAHNAGLGVPPEAVQRAIDQARADLPSPPPADGR